MISRLIYQFIKRPLETRIAAQYEQSQILMTDLNANSFGLESAGAFQIRGNGALVLTRKSLHFFMFLPNKDLCVPLERITELSITKTHLGKRTIYDLLKVQFSHEDRLDSIAWYLPDPQTWKRRIEELKAESPIS